MSVLLNIITPISSSANVSPTCLNPFGKGELRYSNRILRYIREEDGAQLFRASNCLHGGITSIFPAIYFLISERQANEGKMRSSLLKEGNVNRLNSHYSLTRLFSIN